MCVNTQGRLCLPDGLDVHGLRVPQPLPGGGASGWWRGVATVALAVSRVGGVHVVVVVRSVCVAVVEEKRHVALCRVHALHGGVHLIHQLLQVHVVICGSRWRVGWERWRRRKSERAACIH